LKLEGSALRVSAIAPSTLGVQQHQVAVSPGEKGRLRFAGQSFEQWQAVLMTELDPKMRAEALAALGRFGASGYEDEASAAIAEFLSKARLIRTDEGDQKVEEAAAVAFMRIGPKALKTTVKLLKDKSPGVRRLATAVESSLMRDAPDPQPSAVEALVEATSDSDKQVRLAALQALVQIFGPRKVSERNVLVSATMTRLPDNAAEIRRAAANVLAQLGPSAGSAIPALLAALKDPRNEETDVLDFGVLTSVIDALRRCGAPPATLVPALVELLPKAQADFRTLAHIAIVLGSLRSQAASAVPALIDALKRADQTEFRGISGELQSGHHPNAVELIATCLGEIGPTPDSPLVRTVLIGELAKLSDPNSKRHDPPTKDAIEAIKQAMRTLFPPAPERIKPEG
jgi:HEAT repeat protein